MVPDRHDSRLAPCPRCGSGDSILSVPAAYDSAWSAEAAVRAVRDSGGRVTISAAAANDLAMAPDATFLPVVWMFSVLLGIPAIGIPFFYAFQTDHRHGYNYLVFGVILGLLFAFCIFRLSLALARRSKVRAGKPAAEAIWRSGWYCRRCAVVYFQAGGEPSGVTSGQPLTPPQFRHIVWTAGRYGGLA